MMTKREMNLAVFAGEALPHVFFQPRMEPWYDRLRMFDALPERFRDRSLVEVYDDLDLSFRYMHYYTGMPYPIRSEHTEDIKVETHFDKETGLGHQVVTTPYGDLTTGYQLNDDRVWHVVHFPVEGPDDLVKVRWLCDRTRYVFVPEAFDRGAAFMGDRGEPQFWVPKSPYQAMCQVWMTLENFIYALVDVPAQVESVMAAIDRSYDSLYQGILDSGRARIVNFGENLHAHLFSLDYFERYLLEWYRKRSGQLREAGIYTHVHIDGYFAPLLPYLSTLPFDGLEALTPTPQGDVSIAQMQDAIGDKVLLDGIPAVLFMPGYSLGQLQDAVEQLVSGFHPRLVLGISDELPQAAGEDGIEKLEWVAEFCRTHT